MTQKTWTEMTETEKQDAVRNHPYIGYGPFTHKCPVCRKQYGTLEHVARCSGRNPYTGKIQ